MIRVGAIGCALTLLLLVAPASLPVARAALPPVDVALVLVTDVSRSIDDSEFQIEKQGYAAAFTDPKVMAAIHGGLNGRIAVAYVEFASPEQVAEVIDWTVVSDDASAKAFAARLIAAPPQCVWPDRDRHGRPACHPNAR